MKGETDNGKGCCFRKVNGKKYRNNYDLIFKEKDRRSSYFLKYGCENWCTEETLDSMIEVENYLDDKENLACDKTFATWASVISPNGSEIDLKDKLL